MLELSFNNIRKHMGTSLILKDINFQVYHNERVGVVGPNGCGKSTILKLIAGIVKLKLYPGEWSPGYDNGWISKPSHASVAYLDQLPTIADHMTARDVLNLAFTELLLIEKQLRTLEIKMANEQDNMNKVLNRYAELTQTFEVKGGYDMEEKMSRVSSGLNLSEDMLDKAFNTLSGGERTVVMLGKLLMDQPDILLLDEPTNHLDTDAIEWLEHYLKQYKGIVMIVSHDRYFLDNVVNKIIEIEDLDAKTYKGNYSAYKVQKDEEIRIQLDHFKEQSKKVKNMEQTVKELRAWAEKADNTKFYKRAASIQIKLEKMDRVKRPNLNKKSMNLTITNQSRSGNESIKVLDVCKSYGQQVILKEANLLVNYGERVALVGPNGSGKTTLLRLLLGEEVPCSGQLALGANAKVAYLPQEIVFDDEEMTVLDCFREDVYLMEGKSREYLAKYMFFGKRVFTKVKYLSGGERIRLKLAKLLFEEVNLLILDEPTNHLDIEGIETLEDALGNYDGTIFFVSHDRYFVNNVAQRVVALEDKQLIAYEGNYDAYKNELAFKKAIS